MTLSCPTSATPTSRMPTLRGRHKFVHEPLRSRLVQHHLSRRNQQQQRRGDLRQQPEPIEGLPSHGRVRGSRGALASGSVDCLPKLDLVRSHPDGQVREGRSLPGPHRASAPGKAGPLNGPWRRVRPSTADTAGDILKRLSRHGASQEEPLEVLILDGHTSASRLLIPPTPWPAPRGRATYAGQPARTDGLVKDWSSPKLQPL